MDRSGDEESQKLFFFIETNIWLHSTRSRRLKLAITIGVVKYKVLYGIWNAMKKKGSEE